MINISNCPISGLERKVEYDFYWLKRAKQIIVKCVVYYYKDGVQVEGVTRLKPYIRDLVASNSLVNPVNGQVLTPEEISVYNTARQNYLSYQAALVAYTSAMDVYNTNLEEYNIAFAQYQSDLAVYNGLYAQYVVDLAAYNDAMAQSPQNPENLELPTPPNPPIQPEAPSMPTDPAVSPEPVSPGPALMEEYDWYTMVLGVTPIVLPNLLTSIVLSRDVQGKFNI